MRRFGEAKEVCRCGLCDAPMGRKQIALRLTGMNVCGSCFDKMMRGESQNERKENEQKTNEESVQMTHPSQIGRKRRKAKRSGTSRREALMNFCRRQRLPL